MGVGLLLLDSTIQMTGLEDKVEFIDFHWSLTWQSLKTVSWKEKFLKSIGDLILFDVEKIGNDLYFLNSISAPPHVFSGQIQNFNPHNVFIFCVF